MSVSVDRYLPPSFCKVLLYVDVPRVSYELISGFIPFFGIINITTINSLTQSPVCIFTSISLEYILRCGIAEYSRHSLCSFTVSLLPNSVHSFPSIPESLLLMACSCNWRIAFGVLEEVSRNT